MKPKMKVLGKATALTLTAKSYEELPRLSVGRGGYQSTFARIRDSVKIINGRPIAHVYTKDMESLRQWALRSDEGTWQDWSHSVLVENEMLND